MKVAQFGLGPIGIETLRLAASRPWAEVVGGIDIDPAKIGQDLGKLTGVPELRGRRVHACLQDLLQEDQPEVIIHTAVSGFEAAFDQILPVARQGINVVSSCEELLFPNSRNPRLAARLDKACRASGARVVGAGVNPGFVMDILPICLSYVTRQVTRIRVERVVNASTRREPLQRKIGSGLPPQEFRRRFRSGAMGHAGLKDSLSLIAHCLGWKLDRISETGAPVVAKRAIRTRFLEVKKGETCGLHQVATGFEGRKSRLVLDLTMRLDAPEAFDAIRIEGDPPLDLVIRGGVAGDPATSAALVNTAPRLLEARPGLRLLPELPLPRLAP